MNNNLDIDDGLKKRYQLIETLILNQDLTTLQELLLINQQEIELLQEEQLIIGQSLANLVKLKEYEQG